MARHDEREAVPLGSSLAAFFAIWRRCRRACPDVPEGLAQAEAAEGRGHQYWQLERRRHWQDAHGDLARRKISCARKARGHSQPRLSRVRGQQRRSPTDEISFAESRCLRRREEPLCRGQAARSRAGGGHFSSRRRLSAPRARPGFGHSLVGCLATDARRTFASGWASSRTSFRDEPCKRCCLYADGGGARRPRSCRKACSFSCVCRHNPIIGRSEEHTSELQSRLHLVCRLLLEKKK